jgi:hypothetical protein
MRAVGIGLGHNLERAGARLQMQLADGQRLEFVTASVAAGEHVEGYLAVIEVQAPLDLVDVRALEHAATLVAFQLLRERTALDVERRLRGELFQELLSATHGAERGATALLEQLGASTTGPWRVARLELLATDAAGGATGVAFDSRVAAALSGAWIQAGMAAPLVPWRTGFACVIPDDADTGDISSAELADHLTRGLCDSLYVATPELHYGLALGDRVTSPRDLGRSLGQAEDALALAVRLGLLDRVVRSEQLAIERVLLESMDSSSTHEAFVQQVLGPLLDYDATHNRGLLSTLRTYVAADYAPRLAAQRLFIHVNTVHFRLRRIADLVGGNWPHSEQRFRVELALRLTDLLDIRARQHAREHHAPSGAARWRAVLEPHSASPRAPS